MIKILLRLIANFLNLTYKVLSWFIPKQVLDDYKPIPLCWLYGKYGINSPKFVGHNTAPSVTTGSASNITTTSFDMGGDITNTGGVNPTVRGFCYVTGAGGTPTISDTVVNESGSFGTGTYTLNISGLSSGTTYSVRAYATNTSGTGYGSTVEVTTSSNTAPTVALNTPSDEATGITLTPTVEFTGTDADGDDIRYNIQFGTSVDIDSYATSNQDSGDAFASNFTAVGQSFDVPSTTSVVRARVYISNPSSNTNGTVIASIYTISGTHGTSATPNSLQGTSDTVNISTIGTSYELVDFIFSTPVSVTASTNYMLVVTYSGTESVTIGYDGSSPTHAGNYARFSGSPTPSWNSQSGLDMIFELSGSSFSDIDKVSNTDAGFANTVTGGDTDPFNSGEKADYDVQSGDALSVGTEYFWRVRGLDPSGSNSYGAWSTPRSFTTSFSPTVALNTPADAATGQSTTPTLVFTGTDSDGDDIRYNVNIHTDSGFESVDTYYVDGHTSITDETGSYWSNDSNAFDGSISTYAQSTGFVDINSNDLIGVGTTAPSSGNTISQVRARVYGASDVDSPAWSSYVTLTTPTGGWTWQKVQDLTLEYWAYFESGAGDPTLIATFKYSGQQLTSGLFLQLGASATVARAYKAEVEVTSGSLINAVSGTDAGFANVTTPADTDPFNAGDQADYDVQSALANSTTYYWRVRGIDPSGSNTYGAWSSTRSFTTEAGGGGGSVIKTIDGVAIASVKTIDGVAIASVKTRDGVSNV